MTKGLSTRKLKFLLWYIGSREGYPDGEGIPETSKGKKIKKRKKAQRGERLSSKQ